MVGPGGSACRAQPDNLSFALASVPGRRNIGLNPEVPPEPPGDRGEVYSGKEQVESGRWSAGTTGQSSLLTTGPILKREAQASSVCAPAAGLQRASARSPNGVRTPHEQPPQHYGQQDERQKHNEAGQPQEVCAGEAEETCWV